MRNRALAGLAAAGALLIVPAAPADAAKRSCLRGGATLEAVSGSVRVVRVAARPRSARATRHERLLACWTSTGRRFQVAEEVDFGDDNRASTAVEIVDERYVGVRSRNEGGVSESIVARIYDARRAKLLHSSRVCDQLDQGEFSGVEDVAFLGGGGMAIACRQLLLYRKAGSAVQRLEPAGTWVAQLAVSRHTRGFGQRLFWTVIDGDREITKSLLLP